MAIPSRQIGWGTESNLLWQILKQLTRLTSTLFSLKEAATPKYKVFTALVTQSGGDDSVGQTSGTLVIGRTYYISNDCCGADFTNVGAPNNNLGTYFVATGEVPNTWGGTPLGDPQLTYNTGAPIATVLENTIGNISFDYGAEGVYVILCNDLFVEDKTWYTPVIISNTANKTNGEIVWRDVNQIRIITNLDEALADGILNNTPIEIRIYN